MKVGRPKITKRSMTPLQHAAFIRLSHKGGWVSARALNATLRTLNGLVIRGLAYKKIAGVCYQGCDPWLVKSYTYYKARGKAVDSRDRQ